MGAKTNIQKGNEINKINKQKVSKAKHIILLKG